MKRSLRVVARLVVVLMVAELCLRGYSWWSGEQRFYTADPQLGWRVNAGLRRIFGGGEGAYLVQTNSRGFRDLEHAFQKPAGKVRVVVLGASTIFGDGIHQDLLCTEVLERIVPDLEVVNLSCVGYSPAQHDIILSEEGFRYDPDIVIEFLIKTDETCTFDSWDALMQRPKCCLMYDGGEISIRPPQFPPWQVALSSSYLAERLYLLGLPMAALVPDLFTPQPALTEADKLAALRQLVLRTWHKCRERGIEYRAVYLPSSDELDGTASPGNRFMADRLLGRMAAEDALPLVDLTQPLEQAHDDRQRGPVVDFLGLHLNARGHEVVAGELAAVLAPLALTRRSAHTQASSASTQ